MEAFFQNIIRKIRRSSPQMKYIARFEQIGIMIIILVVPIYLMYNILIGRDPVKIVNRYYQTLYAGRYKDAVKYLSNSDQDFKYAAYFVKKTSPTFPKPVKELVKTVHCTPIDLQVRGNQASLICDLSAPMLNQRMTVYLKKEWGRWGVHHGWDVNLQIDFEKNELYKYR